MITVNTRIFGTIEVENDKIIQFANGIIGFPDLKQFILVHDEEKKGGVRWLQSIDSPEFAMPVVDPLIIMEEYNPIIEDELLIHLELQEDSNLLVLTTISIPEEIEKMSVNLMAPMIINVDNQKACQLIIDGDYEIKYPVYELLQARKQERRD